MSYVLFIGLNEPLQIALTDVFTESGYETVSESDPSEGTTMAMSRPPNLIVLAEDTPDIEGKIVLQSLRRLTDAPIIVVGAGSETVVVKALLDGADIYMSRPISSHEMLSRARSLLRRSVSK